VRRDRGGRKAPHLLTQCPMLVGLE
jgi:hypothetical protein